MELKNIRFAISCNADLTELEKQSLLKYYKDYFKEIYGYDIISDYLKEVGNNPKKRKHKLFHDSFVYSIDVLESVKNYNNLALLLIYDENNNLIGAGRLKNINERKIIVPDIAICDMPEEEKRELWKMALAYVEDQFTKLGYEKLSVEVPLNNPYLLLRTAELGFSEHPDDISVDGAARTYLLSKQLERKNHEEFNHSRK